MSGFQERLNDEMKKRGLTSEEEVMPVNKNKKFSFKSFFIGLFLISILLGCMVGWAQMQNTATQDSVAKRLPSKTALVEKIGGDVFRIGSDNKTLTMRSAETETSDPFSNEDQIREQSEEDQAIQAFIIENETDVAPENNTGTGQIAPLETDEPVKAKPFQIYKKDFNDDPSKPNLSIVIVDLGLSQSRSQSLVDALPENVTLALSPYSEYIEVLTTAAREKGKEVWMMLPVQTKDYPLVDSGPLTLLSDASLEQNKNRIDTILNVAQGHVGFIPNKDHNFKAEDGDINPAVKEIFDNGYAILDSNTSGSSFISNLAYQQDHPYAQNSFWLDENLTPLALNQKIRQMIELAEAKGDAVIMLRPYPASINAIQKFLNSSAAQRFDIAPASSILKNAG